MTTVAHATTDELTRWLPPLAADANKYSRGELVIVAGCETYPGAACLAAAAAERTGAGYTMLWGSKAACDALHRFRPSVVARFWEDFDAAKLHGPTPTHPMAVLVGSGLDGGDPADRARALDVIAHAPTPLVVDGGALTALAADEGRAAAGVRAAKGLGLIVTPHGGEAARLAAPLGLPQATLNDPVALAQALSDAYGATVALKGPDTYLTDGTSVYKMDEGTAALAKAGTGDVLAGMTAALLAQGTKPLEAAVLATTLHARAGRIAAERLDERSVIPEDVIEAIPEAFRTLSLNN